MTNSDHNISDQYEQSAEQTPLTEPARRRSARRQSRFSKAQDRRLAQARADQKFYRGIFSLVTFGVLVVLLAAAFGQVNEGMDVPAAGNWSNARFLGLTGLEWIALGVVVIIGLIMWRRITKR